MHGQQNIKFYFCICIFFCLRMMEVMSAETLYFNKEWDGEKFDICHILITHLHDWPFNLNSESFISHVRYMVSKQFVACDHPLWA
jgi:predicted NAD-dependent protein-ADP-ribosyltransferase YbiA (DUF1768 family)